MSGAVLEGKVAIITGAGGGIGRATAILFAAAGARLGLVDSDGDALKGVASELATTGADPTRLLAVTGDVADATSVAGYVDDVVARFGRLDALFNNAGIEGPIATLDDYDDDDFDRVMRVNVRGVWLNLKAAVRAMRTAGCGGSIVNAGSGASLVGVPGASGYAGSKHAVLGLSRSAAVELAPEGIRVNTICPGPIDTRMMRSIEARGAIPRAKIEARVPMGRYGGPAEVAAIALFLASDASSYVTGAVVSVDGGMTAW